MRASGRPGLFQKRNKSGLSTTIDGLREGGSGGRGQPGKHLAEYPPKLPPYADEVHDGRKDRKTDPEGPGFLGSGEESGHKRPSEQEADRGLPGEGAEPEETAGGYEAAQGIPGGPGKRSAERFCKVPGDEV